MSLIHKLLLIAAFALLTTAYVVLLPCPGNVTRMTLHNGLRVVLIRNTLAPVASVSLNYLAGSSDSPPGFPGTAHAVEHMMFRGSPGLSGDQINTILTELGGESNAYTGSTVTRYVATVPASDLGTILRLEAIRMRGVHFDEKLWRIERGAIDQEIARLTDATESDVLTALYKKLYAGTRYENDAGDTVESYDRTDVATLRRFYRQWYAPNNALLVISGDIDPRATLAMVESLFGDIPARQLPRRAPVTLQPLQRAELTFSSHETNGAVALVYRLPGIGDRDYAAGLILAEVLANQRAALHELAVKGEVLDASFVSSALPHAGLGIALASVAAGENLRPKAELLRQTIAAYRKNGVPPELVTAVKHQALLAATLEQNSIPDQADSWAGALSDGNSSPDEEQSGLQQVTVADVNRVARTWLDNDTAVTLLLPAAEDGVKSGVDLKFKRSGESLVTGHFTPVPLPPWAASATRVPADGRHVVPTADMRLANGLRLIMLPSNAAGVMSIAGRVNEPPALEPPGKEGVGSLLALMMSEGGSATLPRQQFRAALDTVGATATIGADFYLAAPADRFEQAVSLLADALLHPELSPAHFATLQHQYGDTLARMGTDPEVVTIRTLLKALYPAGDPTQRRERRENIRRLTLRDVRAYHAVLMRPDMTTMVLTGNIDPARAREILTRYFGSWQGRGARPVAALPPVPDSRRQMYRVTHRGGGRHVDVVLAETNRLARDNPDYEPFRLGLNILAGSYSSRLYQHAREQTGLVYSIEASNDIAYGRGVFRIDYGVDPAHAAKVRRIVEQDIADMQQRPASRAELDQAKRLMLRQQMLGYSRRDMVAELLLSLATDGLPLDLPSRQMARIRLVTPEQVRAALARWVRLGDLSQVIVGGY